MVGITQATRFCQGGNVFLSVDTNLGWFHRDHVFKTDPPEPIRILDERNGTLAGVRVPFDRHIRDPHIQEQIRSNLFSLNTQKGNITVVLCICIRVLNVSIGCVVKSATNPENEYKFIY